MPQATAASGAIAATSPTSFGPTVLFSGDNWIGLTANNEYGFDVLAIGPNGRYESIIGDAKLLMGAFRWHMQQEGLLKTGGVSGIAQPVSRSRTTSVAKTSTAGGVNTKRRAPARRTPVSRVPAGGGVEAAKV